MMTRIDRDHFRGCLLGGSIGDALGYAVEFMSLGKIKEHLGEDGVRDFKLDGRGKALISDDTQMMLFTAEGILNAWKDSINPAHAIWESYLRWYSTQGYPLDERLRKGSLLGLAELNQQRAPGNTCLTALATGQMGNRNTLLNNSKGNGGVMRVAPVGLVHARDSYKAFRLGAESAMITHSHPTGYLAAGVLAAILSEILRGAAIRPAAEKALEILVDYGEAGETRSAVEKALRLIDFNVAPQEALRLLGPGWIAEEALAIGLYASLLYPDDFKEGVLCAVNHAGDSDSTGIVAGNILGAALGCDKIPFDWLLNVELGNVTSGIADELFCIVT